MRSQGVTEGKMVEMSGQGVGCDWVIGPPCGAEANCWLEGAGLGHVISLLKARIENPLPLPNRETNKV